MTIRVGTRSSRLALWQTELVIGRLRKAHRGLACRVVTLSTQGDEVTVRPLPEIGGQGVFTERIEAALRSGEIDIAVHSLKDLPVDKAEGTEIGAVLGREEVRDALVARAGFTLDNLPAGAVVGTSSTRRKAQLLALRPDLVARPIRGNVETRVRKVEEGEYDATLLAGAGLDRLGLAGRVSEWLDTGRFLPAPGQGAIAVQCRASDRTTLALLSAIDEPELRAATEAERGFLQALGGGCSAPIGAYATVGGGTAPGRLVTLRARVMSPDGKRSVEVVGSAGEPTEIATRLAERARAQGAEALLQAAGNAAPASLTGRRVVVTRNREESDELCKRLEALGASALMLPLIRIEAEGAGAAAEEAIRALSTFQWLVFTSANGVDHFLARLAAEGAERGEGVASRLAKVRIAAVGRKTAEAVARWGLAVDLVPGEATGAALARELGERLAYKPARILLARAREGGEEITAILRGRGAEVVDLPVYRTVAAEPSDADVAAVRGEFDAILFASGSAVRAFAALAAREPEIATAADRAAVVCIGPSTAEAARSLGLRVAVTADEHTSDGLLRALVAFFEDYHG